MLTTESSTRVNVVPSVRPGMGSLLYPGGAAFRVWAPFATSASVAGSFNAWNPRANPLASEGNGYWSADVPGVKVGHQYKLVIPLPNGMPPSCIRCGRPSSRPTMPTGTSWPCATPSSIATTAMPFNA